MRSLSHVATITLGLFVAMLVHPLHMAKGSVDRIPQPASGRAVSPDTLLPADVLARVKLLHDELEAIRFEMGRPKDSRRLGVASDAAPHEVYFQAITLFLKADRLALELAGSTGVQPELVSPLDIRPYHVWKIVNAAYGRILTVKQELGITRQIVEAAQDPATSPTDVGYAIVRANRQINRMLERRFTPSDVYQQVRVAIAYADGLLGRFPGAAAVPEEPPYERGKEPADVFFRLAECYQQLESIARHSGLQVVHLDTKEAARGEILPSDVYDLATLLVSDLAFLHARLRTTTPPPLEPYPGRKFPSHVYQQADILHAQLLELEKRVAADPNWLSH